MKALFTIFFLILSLNLFAGTISAKVSVQSQKNQVRNDLLQSVKTPLGKKELIYQKGDIKFYASINEFKEKLPEMPQGTPVIIYGEVYKGTKIIGHPQIVTLLGHEATFTSETAQGEFFEIKFLPTKLTR
ncbi:MAG: hypothetical protein ACOYL6_09285 [Bacteriovoracaceae bacterium]